jgi:mannose-1-phosphate guanylyltransferase
MRSGANVVVQPRNCGTAVGILLPLLHLARRDPRARVVLLPSDHFVEDERTLARALRGAMIDAASYSDDVLLLGIRPDVADPELGYLVPGRQGGMGLAPVAHFAEKPSRRDLESLLALYERRFPEVLTALDLALEREQAGDLRAVTELYERLPTIDFSKHLLQGQERYLRAVVVPPCGWSDLGTPHRVAAALRQRPASRFVRERVPAAILDLAAQHHRLQLAGV